MKKKVKILFFFSLILLALILFLVLTSESIEKTDKPGLPTGQAGLSTESVKNAISVLSEEDYKAKVKEIFSAYEKLPADSGLTMGKIIELKDKLVAFKGLPAKFKDLHLKLVQSLDKMENYLNQKNEGEKNASLEMTNQIKADYSWLNN